MRIAYKGFLYEAEQIPETIEVNGASKPTRNSEGRLIYSNIKAILNFWSWFGDSKTLDKNGRPLVVYHGSPNPSFDEFSNEYSSDETLAYGKGVYTTVSSDAASGYATSGSSWGNKEDEKVTGAVYPLYIKIVNPFDLNKQYPYNVVKKLTESLDMGNSLKDVDNDANFESSNYEEISNLEDLIYRIESGDEEAFTEYSGYEMEDYNSEDGVFDQEEYDKDIQITISSIRAKLDKLEANNEAGYNQHMQDLDSLGVVSGNELYKLIYTHTEGYHDYSIESRLIGGNSDLMEFKTEANEILMENGYDGLVHMDEYNPGANKVPHLVYIAFNTDQVKSATGNSGSYGTGSRITTE